MDKSYRVRTCQDCPFFAVRYHGDPCECIHTGAPQGAYENIVGPADIPPKWCPVRKAGGSFEKLVRNDYDHAIGTITVTLES